MSLTQPRFLFADYMRSIATLAVILLHSAGDLLYNFNPNNYYDTHWWTGNIYDSAVRWCVPVFVMLSGCLLLRPNKPEPIDQFLKKRMTRVLIPFVFWAIVYLTYENRGYIRDGKMPWFGGIFHEIMFGTIYFHLWFVPMILGLYFLIPVFRVFIKHATRFEIEYFLTFWFWVSAIQVHFPDFFLVKYIGWLAYIGYIVLGDYLTHFKIEGKKYIYGVGWLSLALTIGGTFHASAYFASFCDKFYDYLCPTVMFMAVAVFLYIKEYDWASFNKRFPLIHRFVSWFSGISFGVYLAHVLFLDLFKNAYLFGIKNTSSVFLNMEVAPIIGAPLFALLVTLCSIATIVILCKIPFLEKIVK